MYKIVFPWAWKKRRWRAETSVIYSIWDQAIYTTTLWRSCSKFLQDFRRVHLSNKIHAKVVHWVSTPKPPFMIRTVERRRSLKYFTHMCVDRSRQLPQQNIGIFTFQRDSGTPLTLKYVICVPSLKNNLVSDSMLEDHGYDVIFSKGKVFLHHKDTG